MPESRLEEWNTILKTVWKDGADVLKSSDPFEALLSVFGKKFLGSCLSKFNCCQIAGILGVVVTTFLPQVSVPLLLKKITDDLKSLKKGLDVVRYQRIH